MTDILGVIGGSGLYEMEGMKNVRRERIRTPFGDPSDSLVLGEAAGTVLAFLPRHGRGHRIPPSQINFRANIYAMKKVGAKRLLSISAVGSMRERIRPGDVVVVDQFYDHTRSRVSSFFTDGIVAHIPFADPVCPVLSDLAYRSARQVTRRVHRGGTYLCMEGPAFSTRAESRTYRKWGVDVIGMTNMPEAKLAREAQICYATLALATDYDCWRESEADVSIEAILEIVRKNVANSKRIIQGVAELLPGRNGCGCAGSLRNAIITDKKAIPAATRKRLSLLAGEYL